jgi:hypothetical protein
MEKNDGVDAVEELGAETRAPWSSHPRAPCRSRAFRPVGEVFRADGGSHDDQRFAEIEYELGKCLGELCLADVRKLALTATQEGRRQVLLNDGLGRLRCLCAADLV